MSDHTHRLFVAIPIPEQVRLFISEKINTLDLPLKFIPPENFHITVLFMGNISEAKMEESKVFLEKISNQLACFPLTLEAIVSKSNRHQYMLWVSLSTLLNL